MHLKAYDDAFYSQIIDVKSTNSRKSFCFDKLLKLLVDSEDNRRLFSIITAALQTITSICSQFRTKYNSYFTAADTNNQKKVKKSNP